MLLPQLFSVSICMNTFFHPPLSVFLYISSEFLICSLYKGVVFYSFTPCILIGAFGQFTFKVIIDMYVLITILLIVFWLFYSFCSFFFFCSFLLWSDDHLSFIFGFLFLFLFVYIICFWFVATMRFITRIFLSWWSLKFKFIFLKTCKFISSLMFNFSDFVFCIF